MSSDLLRRAATALREAASQATPGPWANLGDGDRIVRIDGRVLCDYVVDEPMSHEGNAAWIILANPLIAEPLAAWLEAEAAAADRMTFHNLGDCDSTRKALAVARVILGEVPTDG